MPDLRRLGTAGPDGGTNAVIETPRGSRNKYKLDAETGLVRLDKVLPAGAVFPYDFGYVPGTRGEDGDPVDVLVLADEPVFSGCVVEVRLIGVIEANQTETDGKTVRNDRLLAVPAASRDRAAITDLEQLDANLLGEIEHFFASYCEMEGKVFAPIRRRGPKRAAALVRAARVSKRKRAA